MMYCKDCGKPLKENETCICQNAGTKKLPKPLLVASGVIAVVIIVIIALFSSGTEKINLEDYLNTQPEISGLNGRAVIEMSSLFDASSLESYLLESLGDKGSEDMDNLSEGEFESLLAGAGEGFLACEQAVNDIEVKVWKDGSEVNELNDLSNGTVIKVKASSSNPVNKYLDKNFKTGSVEFEVEGLMDGTTVDVFEEAGLKVSFSGTDGNGQVDLEWDQDALTELSFGFYKENASLCKNGDEIKIVLDYDREEWELLGYLPLEESRTYTVEGLSMLLSAIEEIQEEQMIQMKAEVEADFKETAENEWRDGISIENMTYVGSYLLNKKDGDMSLGASNILYLVYKVDVFENFAPNGGEDTHFSYYYYGSYENLLLDTQGKVDLENAKMTPCWNYFVRDICMGNSILMGSVWVDYTGFETLEEVYTKCVENNSEHYTSV